LTRFERRFLQTGKAVVMTAIALTGMCALAVGGWQLVLLFGGEGWLSER
jgi:ABC-type sulfate transport system permease subunit